MGLPLVQVLGCHEVLQALVVCPDLALMFCALDKVPPFLEARMIASISLLWIS